MMRASTLNMKAVLPPLGLVAASAIFFAYLLLRYRYDGLYGQDSYAYYYQALALWNDLTGQPQPANWLSTSDGFRWPIGYHLHIMAGFVFGGTGPEGGRLLTLLLAAAAPGLVYLLVQEVWPGSSGFQVPGSRFQVDASNFEPSTFNWRSALAGLSAGALLVLSGTYTRFGLSLMSDVPALFWSLLALLFFLKTWSSKDGASDTGRPLLALAAGLALGVAVLVRYGSLLLLAPVAAYSIARRATQPQRTSWQGEIGTLMWAAAGLALALLPQAAYSLTHPAGAGYTAFLGDWNIVNIFSSRVTSADGSATYDYSMIEFYLLSPLAGSDTSAGLLSRFYLPALGLGAWALFRERRWPAIALLATWWLVPVLVFSGTPYQSHRFVLTFLPALVIVCGIGIATALDALFTRLGDARRKGQIGTSLVAALVLLSIGVGVVQGWRGVDGWVRTHVAFKEDESKVVGLAHDAAGGAIPRVVSFGTTAALFYYTRWPMLDFYNADEREMENFFKEPGTRLVVLPEESMATQWAGTPSGARWEWIQRHYQLRLEGKGGGYSVYQVQDRP